MAAKSKTNTNKENDKVTVIIPKPTNVVGDTETIVAINGEMYQIMYDKPVEVPRNVAEVIEQSRRLLEQIDKLSEECCLKPGKPALAEL